MKKTSMAVLVSLLAVSGVAMAQNDMQSPSSEIRMSTDPARAAEIEQHAAEIRARQQAEMRDATSGASSTPGMSPSERPQTVKRSHTKQRKAKKQMRPKGDAGTSGMSSDAMPGGQSGNGAGSTSK